MAFEPNESQEDGRAARTAAPALQELLGDFSRFPPFREIALVCEHACAAGQLAWPMPLPFPPSPPRPPDFAGLDALYCNHLGYLLRDASSPDAGALLAFFAWIAACHAASLEAGLGEGHAARVCALVASSLRCAGPGALAGTSVEAALARAGHVAYAGADAVDMTAELMRLSVAPSSAKLAPEVRALYARFASATAP